MNYWLVRAKWGVENKKAEFINNDEWINGYTDKYLEIVKRVEIEDILLLADDLTVTHYGKCVANPQDGKYLTVDRWVNFMMPFFHSQNFLEKAIIQVSDAHIINLVTGNIKDTILNHDIKITHVYIENFTVFKQENLEISEGFNIVIGENGVGKTHLIKLLYSLIYPINGMPFYEHPEKHEGGRARCHLELLFLELFKANQLSNLISNNKSPCYIDIGFNKLDIRFILENNTLYTEGCNKDILFFTKSIFIPAKEILSFYEGFISLYENRETSFDGIYYNLAKALSLPLLKNINSYPVEYKVLQKLEEILEGKVVLENGRFYLLQNNRKTEISLIAEGFRKIGMIAQLLANGSLTKNSILFWDEPETNLNPRLIRKMAEVLVELSRAGMQIFIATHSLFLVKEIEILRNKQDKVKYFGLGFNDAKEVRISQSEDFEYLEDIVILDEELAQDDRFLAKEEG